MSGDFGDSHVSFAIGIRKSVAPLTDVTQVGLTNLRSKLQLVAYHEST